MATKSKLLVRWALWVLNRECTKNGGPNGLLFSIPGNGQRHPMIAGIWHLERRWPTVDLVVHLFSESEENT